MDLDPLGAGQVEYAVLQSHPTFIGGGAVEAEYASPHSSAVLMCGEQVEFELPW